MKKIKVAISQRIIPHYRVPVFTELARRNNIDLTVYYGKGFKTGASVNSENIEGFNSVKLFTIFLSFLNKKNKQLIVFHPTLLFHLLIRRFDIVIVEPSTNIFNDIFIFGYCKIFNKKFIWYEAGAVPKKNRTFYRKLMDPVIDILTKSSNAFITYNSFADQYLIDSFNIPSEKIFRAQNTLDTSKISKDIYLFKNQVKALRSKLEIIDTKVALFIGGIEKRKRINNLITAVSNVNKMGIKTKTIIVGDGQDMNWVKTNMNKEEVSSTIFVGKHIDDAVLYILLSDVVVLPAQGGLSINHAFACGKPFIGTTETVSPGTNSIYDYIKDGINGFVIKVDDVGDLTDRLYQLFSDDSLYKKACQEALKSSKYLTVPRMVDGIENAITYCCNV